MCAVLCKRRESSPHLPVLLHKLEGLDESEGLVHAPAHGEVIDGHLPHHTLGVDDEEAWRRSLP